MDAKSLMQTNLVISRVDESAGDLVDRLQAAHVHAAPVVDEEGTLIGIVSVEDILFGDVFASTGADPATVGEIMTSPVFSAEPATLIAELCEMMWDYRVHHLPVQDEGILVGMVSSLDICRLVRERGLQQP